MDRYNLDTPEGRAAAVRASSTVDAIGTRYLNNIANSRRFQRASNTFNNLMAQPRNAREQQRSGNAFDTMYNKPYGRATYMRASQGGGK